MMKLFLFLSFCLVAMLLAFAEKQDSQQEQISSMAMTTRADSVVSENEKVYDVVEQMPSFPGGPSALFDYLSNTVRYPPAAMKKGIQGRVICTFVVEGDGSISDVKVTKSVDESLDREAVRVLRVMPRWIPGRQDGKPVRVKYTVPMAFRL